MSRRASRGWRRRRLAPAIRTALLAALLTAACSRSASAQPAKAGGRLEVAWRADVGRTLGAELALSAGSLAATTLDRRCALLDGRSGRKLWSVRESDGIQGGLCACDAGWVGITDPPGNHLVCLDRETGRSRWRRPWGEAVVCPIAEGGRIYAAGLSGRVEAFSAADGTTLWSYSAPAPVRSRLALVDSLLLVPTAVDSLIALEASGGRFRWGASPGGALYAPPRRVGERLYSLSYEGTLTVLDAASGARIAARTLPGFYRAGLAGEEPLIALSTAGRVTALRPGDLELLWQRDLGSVGETTPLLADGLVWVGLRDGSLQGLEARTGETRYQLRVPPPARTPVVSEGDMLWIGAGAGEVIAYRWLIDPAAAPGRGAVNPGVGRAGLRSIFGGGLGLPEPPVAGLPSTLAARTLCRGDGGGEAVGLSRWRWPATAAFGLFTALALWLQDRADGEYDRYLTTGSPGARESALDRAEDYDRAVVASWIAAEVGFALGVKAWLDAQSGGGRP